MLQIAHEKTVLERQAKARAAAFLENRKTNEATDAVAKAIEDEAPMSHQTMEELIDKKTSTHLRRHGQKLINQVLTQTTSSQKNSWAGSKRKASFPARQLETEEIEEFSSQESFPTRRETLDYTRKGKRGGKSTLD